MKLPGRVLRPSTWRSLSFVSVASGVLALLCPGCHRHPPLAGKSQQACGQHPLSVKGQVVDIWAVLAMRPLETALRLRCGSSCSRRLGEQPAWLCPVCLTFTHVGIGVSARCLQVVSDLSERVQAVWSQAVAAPWGAPLGNCVRPSLYEAVGTRWRRLGPGLAPACLRCCPHSKVGKAVPL